MIKLKDLFEADQLPYDEFTHQIQSGQKYKGGIEIVSVSGSPKKSATGRMPTSQVVTYKVNGKEKKETIKRGDKRFLFPNLVKEMKKKAKK